MSKHIHRLTIFGNACIGIACALAFAGCISTPHRVYSGDPLPDGQIARVTIYQKELSTWEKINRPVYPIGFFITHVDQEKLGSFWGSQGDKFKAVDLLPGDHTLTILMSQQGPGLIPNAIQSHVENQTNHVASGYGRNLPLKAEAGHQYVVKYVENRLPIICWIEDMASGKVVSGEKPDDDNN